METGYIVPRGKKWINTDWSCIYLGLSETVKFVPPVSYFWPVNYTVCMDHSVLPLNFWSTVSRYCTCDCLSSMVTDWLVLTNNYLFSLTSIFKRLFVWKALAELEEKCDHKIERIQLNPKTTMGQEIISLFSLQWLRKLSGYVLVAQSTTEMITVNHSSNLANELLLFFPLAIRFIKSRYIFHICSVSF